LELIKSYFGGIGDITEVKNSVQYRVTSQHDLINVIIPHFIKFPLITQKCAYFEFFKMVTEIMSRKEHLTIKGLHKIVSIKASMNKGLSDDLKNLFPNIIPVKRYLVQDQIIKDPP
jgi:LAGLIDADG endonuclease